LGWSELVIVADPLTVLENYGSDPKLFLGLMGLDLTDFFTNCAISIYCHNDIYEARYDGFAMIAELNLGDLTETTDPSAFVKIVNCIEINTDRYSCFAFIEDIDGSDYKYYVYSGLYVSEDADILERVDNGCLSLPYAS
jgi:hypothetical protein